MTDEDLIARLERFSTRPIEQRAPAPERLAMADAANRLTTLLAERDALTEKVLFNKRQWAQEAEHCRKARDEAHGLAHQLHEMEAERDAALVVELGVGKRVVNWGMYAGNPAVFIEPLPDGKPGIEGELVPDELQGPKDNLLPGAIILSFHEYPNTFLDCLRKALNYEDALDAALVEGARQVTDEMVERGAQAMCRLQNPDHDWQLYKIAARVCLTATLSSIKDQADAG